MVKIAVLNRAWVVVGDYYQDGQTAGIRRGYVVRRWGTTMGLGELAMNGPTSSTVLDPMPGATWHILASIMVIDCVEAKWSAVMGKLDAGLSQ